MRRAPGDCNTSVPEAPSSPDPTSGSDAAWGAVKHTPEDGVKRSPLPEAYGVHVWSWAEFGINCRRGPHRKEPRTHRVRLVAFIQKYRPSASKKGGVGRRPAATLRSRHRGDGCARRRCTPDGGQAPPTPRPDRRSALRRAEPRSGPGVAAEDPEQLLREGGLPGGDRPGGSRPRPAEVRQ